MAIHHSDRAHATARRLRKALTPAETVLWRHLRGGEVDGLRFRRQAPLGPYVVDFCCLSQRLVVEADGGIHDLREAEDAARDAWLATQGFRVLRFSNAAILGRVDVVLDGIRKAMTGGAVSIPPIRPAPPATFPRKGGRA